MFDEQIARKPNRYPWAKDFVDAMHQGHWTSADFDFHNDKIDFYSRVDEVDRQVICKALSAISQIEVAVKTFWAKLGENLPHPSLVDLGFVMANIEVIHNDAYQKLLEVLDMEHIFEENLKNPIFANRVNYLRKYTKKCYSDKKKQYIYAIILFTLFVENVSLFSQFYTSMWFYKNKNVFKRMAQQIKYTVREEDIHAKVGIKIINTLRTEYPELFDAELEERILSEAKEAFEAESRIIDWMLGEFNAPDLNPTVLKEYIKNRINVSLKDIGYTEVFTVDKNEVVKTIWLDEMTNGNVKTDFFHAKPTDYNKRKITVEELFPKPL